MFNSARCINTSMRLQEHLDYLLEVETQQQRLDKLIRQGMLPARQLPILHRALAGIKMGKILAPYEREALSKLLDKMMGFQFGDDITYNRARLHTQKTKYQTEERDMVNEEDVKVYDGSEDEEETKKDKKVKKNGSSKKSKAEKDQQKDDEAVTEAVGNRPADKEEGDKESPKQGGSVKPEITDGPAQDSKPSIKEGLIADLDSEGKRQRATRLSKRFGRRAKDAKMKGMSPELRRQKRKAGVSEDIAKFNELYKKNLETALGNNEVDNVRDIPESIKQDLFQHVEEATHSKKQIKMAKGIAFDKRYKGGNMTGAAKQMEKIKKGLSDHPEVSKALRTANEETETETKIEKSPNQVIRDVHKTVADVMAGRSIEVSDEPLVVDPNVESQAELDRTVNVQEGAREDAMRDMKSPGATKGMAPLKKAPKDPGKSKHDGSANKGPDHIVSQIRKAISLGDKHDGVKFQDGSTHKVSVAHAHKFHKKYMDSKPADKLKMQSHAHASHDNFKKHLD